MADIESSSNSISIFKAQLAEAREQNASLIALINLNTSILSQLGNIDNSNFLEPGERFSR